MLFYVLGGILTYNLLDRYKQRLYFYPSKLEYKTKYHIKNIGNHYVLTNIEKISKKRCMIISHGNAGNIMNRDYIIDELIKQKYDGDIFCYEYCGFYKCEGTANINNCVNEHIFWIKHLSQKYEKIDLWGESIGGAILLETLSQLNHSNFIENIYLDRTFSKLSNVISSINPNLGTLYNVLFFNDLESINLFNNKNIKNKKITILHSKHDEIIPYSEAINNYDECIELKIDVKFIEIHGSHNNPKYILKIF
jgi:hypothetical protein